MSLPKELDHFEGKSNFPIPVGKDSLESNQYFYITSFGIFDRLSFQDQIEKKQTLFTATKLNTVHSGVCSY